MFEYGEWGMKYQEMMKKHEKKEKASGDKDRTVSNDNNSHPKIRRILSIW